MQLTEAQLLEVQEMKLERLLHLWVPLFFCVWMSDKKKENLMHAVTNFDCGVIAGLAFL